MLFVINFHKLLGEWNLRQFWNITSGIYAKYHVQIMLLFVYTTTRKGFVIFTRTSNWKTIQYSSWNTTAQSQSNAEISHVVVQLLKHGGTWVNLLCGSICSASLNTVHNNWQIFMTVKACAWYFIISSLSHPEMAHTFLFSMSNWIS